MLTTTVKITIRQNIPLDHLQAALLISRLVKEIEDKFTVNEDVDKSSDHSAYSLSSIYMIVGFLESSINDLFANAKDSLVDQLKGIESHIPNLATYNEKHISKNLEREIVKNTKSKVIKKYQYALQLMNIDFYDISEPVIQDLALLISIRNHFLHHSATWLECNPVIQNEYKTFVGRIKENPFFRDKGNPYFPFKLLGYGFIQWGIDSSIKFVMDFYNKIRLEYYFMKQLESKLNENKNDK
jgi:hypothetical protein